MKEVEYNVGVLPLVLGVIYIISAFIFAVISDLWLAILLYACGLFWLSKAFKKVDMYGRS